MKEVGSREATCLAQRHTAVAGLPGSDLVRHSPGRAPSHAEQAAQCLRAQGAQERRRRLQRLEALSRALGVPVSSAQGSPKRASSGSDDTARNADFCCPRSVAEGPRLT